MNRPWMKRTWAPALAVGLTMMTMIGTATPTTRGQDTPEPTRGAVGLPVNVGQGQGGPSRYSVPNRESFAEVPSASSSLLRQRPWHDDFVPRGLSPGFSDPGNEGRMAEYTPPGGQFQNPGGARTAARFDSGGRPNRSEQLQSQAVGTARYSALQSHIDTYGTPRWGFGMGFGMGW